MDAELDLLPGQIDLLDKKPADYSSPKGKFMGQGYRLEGDTVKPVYQKSATKPELFVEPKAFTFDTFFKDSLREFLFSQLPVSGHAILVVFRASPQVSTHEERI